MGLTYKRLNESDIASTEDIFLLDRATGYQFLWALKHNPEHLSMAYLDDTLVGLVLYIPGTMPLLSVYVLPPHRQKGIGTALVHYGEAKAHEDKAKAILSLYLAGEPAILQFVNQLGYEKTFASACMKHNQGPFSMEAVPVRPYINDDYSEGHDLYEQAFHEMRVQVGHFPGSKPEPASEKSRLSWLSDANNRFTYAENGVIAGHGHLEDDEIDSIAIKRELQGQGIGRKFVKYLCNELYGRGYEEVILWCVVGNYKARLLYESLGFKEQYVIQYASKKL